MSGKNIRFAILIAFVAGAFLAVRWSGLGERLDPESLRGWISGFGVWGPVVYMLIYCAGAGLMVPGLALTVAGGVLFGPVWGSVYVLIGATCGAALAFLIARYMGRDWVRGVIARGGSRRIKELDERVEKQGWKIVAFTRLIPLFPYNFLNYAYGLTSIKFLHYLFATFFFMIPGVVAYVVFSSSLLGVFQGRISREFLIGVILVVIISLLPLFYKRFKKNGTPPS